MRACAWVHHVPALTGEGLHLAMSAVEREESEGGGNLADDGAVRARVAQVERGASEDGLRVVGEGAALVPPPFPICEL